MNRLRAFGAFLYDFVIGDDPTAAAVIVVALGVTALIASGGTAAWWVMPPAVIGALAFSLYRATQAGIQPPPARARSGAEASMGRATEMREERHGQSGEAG